MRRSRLKTILLYFASQFSVYTKFGVDPNGVDIKTVSGMLGHYSAGFTLDTYTHVTTLAQTKAAETIGGLLANAVS